MRIEHHRRGRLRAIAYGVAALAAAAVAAYLLWPAQTRVPAAVAERDGQRAGQAPATGDNGPLDVRARAAAPQAADADPRLGRDLADVIPPGTPEPGMAEVIRGLHAAGIRSGLGAFNPPGTSPPLEGLAVPADFPLPEGYVRHHQVTDDGQDIEPILMFSPDYEFQDAAGRPVAIPPDRVVPPHLAPPGLPIRLVRIPPPRAPGRSAP